MSDEDEGLKTAEDFAKKSRIICLKNAVLLDALEQVEENECRLIQRIKMLETKLKMGKNDRNLKEEEWLKKEEVHDKQIRMEKEDEDAEENNKFIENALLCNEQLMHKIGETEEEEKEQKKKE